MNQKWDGIEFRKQLRTQSESMVNGLFPKSDVSAQPIEALMHELLVHKIELELQNEELRKANFDAIAAQDRYWQIYELAPVGHITLTREGLIDDINLTGCMMLGVDRSALVNRHFAKLIEPNDRDRWHCLFQNLIQQSEGEKRSLRLKMTCRNESVFSAYLDCWRVESSGETSTFRVVMIDVDKILRAECG